MNLCLWTYFDIFLYLDDLRETFDWLINEFSSLFDAIFYISEILCIVLCLTYNSRKYNLLTIVAKLVYRSFVFTQIISNDIDYLPIIFGKTKFPNIILKSGLVFGFDNAQQLEFVVGFIEFASQ
jgi:hypothetical protein